MGYEPTVKSRTKAEIAIARRNAQARKKAAEKAAEMKKAKKKSNSFAEQEGEGYAKGGMVMKSKNSKKSKKPRGSGCAARTKRTKIG